jgi:hypothetical protein
MLGVMISIISMHGLGDDLISGLPEENIHQLLTRVRPELVNFVQDQGRRRF